jgi:hypothetical protein
MNREIELNPLQASVWKSQTKETFFLAGLGSGKTFLLGLLLFNALRVPGSVHGLFAPTRPMLVQSTWSQLKQAWEVIGMIEGKHYVHNRKPPAAWKISNFPFLSATNILTTRWGSFCVTDGLDNFDAQRGKEFDEIFIDEFRNVKEEARTVLLARTRGNTYKRLGYQYRIWYATTPPENPFYLLKLLHEPNITFVQGSTHFNKANLPDGYIESLRTVYDSQTFLREVEGKLIKIGGKEFAYAFDREKHVYPGSGWELYDPAEPLYISFDFNVLPFCAGIFQCLTERIVQLDEYYIENASVYEVCDRIRADLGDKLDWLHVTGDATGRGRQVLSKGLLNTYEVIQSELDINPNLIDTPRSNPAIRDSFILVNSIFERFPEILIGENCENTIQDLETVQITERMEIDKETDAKRTHCLDFFRYLLHTYYKHFIRADHA